MARAGKAGLARLGGCVPSEDPGLTWKRDLVARSTIVEEEL